MSEQKQVLNFGKRINIPDVNDRTGNDPYYLMSSNDVFKVINEHRLFRTQDPILNKREINDISVAPIVNEALVGGWSEVKLVGKQLLFISELKALGSNIV